MKDFKQNVIINTEDGKVKLQFDFCQKCDYYEFCYKNNGIHHGEFPNGLSEECLSKL